jgi:hypothetical protein
MFLTHERHLRQAQHNMALENAPTLVFYWESPTDERSCVCESCYAGTVVTLQFHSSSTTLSSNIFYPSFTTVYQLYNMPSRTNVRFRLSIPPLFTIASTLIPSKPLSTASNHCLKSKDIHTVSPCLGYDFNRGGAETSDSRQDADEFWNRSYHRTPRGRIGLAPPDCSPQSNVSRSSL